MSIAISVSPAGAFRHARRRPRLYVIRTAMSDPVFEVVRTVLAVREYQDKPVPHEVMRRVVEAAHLTASAGNRQPWHFVLVEERDSLRELAGLVRTGPYIAGSGAAVIVAVEKATAKADVDAARAIQSMILVAWADGVGSNWTGFGGLEEVRQWAGLPDTFDVLAVVPFGYPKRTLGLGKKKRKPLDEIASAERHGNPLS
jgi:nitroreductase